MACMLCTSSSDVGELHSMRDNDYERTAANIQAGICKVTCESPPTITSASNCQNYLIGLCSLLGIAVSMCHIFRRVHSMIATQSILACDQLLLRLGGRTSSWCCTQTLPSKTSDDT